jgi:hypothetical protein
LYPIRRSREDNSIDISPFVVSNYNRKGKGVLVVYTEQPFEQFAEPIGNDASVKPKYDR